MEDQASIDTLNQTALTRLMRLGIAGPHRPVDALIQRLGASGGSQWLERILKEDLPERERVLIALATSRRASLEELHELKDLSKVRLGAAKTENDRVCALFSYFISLAGGLALHEEVITSRSAGELEEVLIDLAETLSGEYQDLVSEGGIRAGEIARP